MSPAGEPEWLTRKKRIDPRLKALGWPPVAFDPSQPPGAYQCQAVTEYETDNGPADYALCLDGKIHGIVEPTEGERSGTAAATRAGRCCSCLSRPIGQGTYGAVTVSPSALPDVTRYVDNQVEHHQRNYLDVELETVEMPDD